MIPNERLMAIMHEAREALANSHTRQYLNEDIVQVVEELHWRRQLQGTPERRIEKDPGACPVCDGVAMHSVSCTLWKALVARAQSESRRDELSDLLRQKDKELEAAQKSEALALQAERQARECFAKLHAIDFILRRTDWELKMGIKKD